MVSILNKKWSSTMLLLCKMKRLLFTIHDILKISTLTYLILFILKLLSQCTTLNLGGLWGTLKKGKRVNTLASNPNLNVQLSQV